MYPQQRRSHTYKIEIYASDFQILNFEYFFFLNVKLLVCQSQTKQDTLIG